MIRELLVAIHASSGIAGLAAGLLVFRPPQRFGGRALRWRAVYAGLLLTLATSLLILVVSDWDGLATGARIAFTGLAVLSLIMLARIYLAHRVANERKHGWEQGYVGHVYFTYISLWVGLAIIPALRTSTPGLWIPVAVIAVLGTGSVLVNRFQRHIRTNNGT